MTPRERLTYGIFLCASLGFAGVVVEFEFGRHEAPLERKAALLFHSPDGCSGCTLEHAN
jgi:hypothetical protein